MNKRARSMMSKFDRALGKFRKLVATEEARGKKVASTPEDLEMVAALKSTLQLIETDREKFAAVHGNASSNSTPHRTRVKRRTLAKRRGRALGGRGR